MPFVKTEPTVSVKGLSLFVKRVIRFYQKGYSFLYIELGTSNTSNELEENSVTSKVS